MRGVRRVELVVVGAILLSTPSLLQAFSGGIGLTTALLRLAGALALCWAVGAIVERTIDGYARQARQKELAQRIEQVKASRAATMTLTGDRTRAEALAPAPSAQGEVRPFQ